MVSACAAGRQHCTEHQDKTASFDCSYWPSVPCRGCFFHKPFPNTHFHSQQQLHTECRIEASTYRQQHDSGASQHCVLSNPSKLCCGPSMHGLTLMAATGCPCSLNTVSSSPTLRAQRPATASVPLPGASQAQRSCIQASDCSSINASFNTRRSVNVVFCTQMRFAACMAIGRSCVQLARFLQQQGPCRYNFSNQVCTNGTRIMVVTSLAHHVAVPLCPQLCLQSRPLLGMASSVPTLAASR